MKKFAVKTLVIIISLLFTLSSTASARICISDISIKGNKTTNTSVILREIPVKAGVFLSLESLQGKVEKIRENLRNTSLFNEVSVTYEPDTVSCDSHLCILENNIKNSNTYKYGEEILFYRIVVDVTERWYYWPVVGLKLEERNLSTWLKDMDFNKITFDAGVKIYNVWGLKHKLTLSGKFGFEKGAKLSYEDICFDHKGVHSLSASAYYLYKKTINLNCEDNKPVYIKNERFLDKNVGGTVSYMYRPEIRIRHKVSLEYKYKKLNDSVLTWNPNYYYTNKTSSHELSLKYSYAYDQRDYVVYPTKGYYIGVQGNAITANNFGFWYGNALVDAQYYVPLGKRWYASTALKFSTSFKNHRAYIFDKAIGYDNVNICGYEYYVIDGQHYVTSNNTLKFLLLPEKKITLNFLKGLPKFNKIPFTVYTTLSVDMGYAYNKYKSPSNNLQNSFLMGAALGIDILTYYDIVFNVSYAYNILNKGGVIFGLKTTIF
ncbi:MAG: BamA/TamA family outer membrane protein [Bacteroidales bacterium]|nr:BamA/TamA family outer membrane protein [Bacteroidales bacterium]